MKARQFLLKVIDKLFPEPVKPDTKVNANPFENSEYVIKEVCTIGGITYYAYDDAFNTPVMRGLDALSIYNEVSMRCDRVFLQAYTDAISNILSKTQIDLFKIHELNTRLKERLTYANDLDLCYKLASVILFDRNENPLVYEPKYAAEKIAHWKKHMPDGAFFLAEPMRALLPFIDFSGINIQAYTKIIEEVKKQDWKTVLSALSEEQRTTYTTASSL
jgi:hypothetical protein